MEVEAGKNSKNVVIIIKKSNLKVVKAMMSGGGRYVGEKKHV